MKAEIPESRKFLYYLGMAIMAVGFLLFLSVFFSMILLMGDRTPLFGIQARFDLGSFALRGVGGVLLVIVGGFLRHIGFLGLAGSGVTLDPDQAREDVKPWSQMAGGVINDAVSEIDVVNKIANRVGHAENAESPARETIKVRCPACRALNDENARFCNQCGKAL